ncbi:hypothetical protein BN873_300026 [Candidatus Competibacter denitrificans Run_A_D11]|uniref:Uncharacterized protein n=1 Tax=Candidatus Competibacter denitrificans Run_A_D11 TaxID=1400863 RepID=W6M9G9_9GAMM|nr:hypothetical protein BN873_300026 [Candidatus Competibacter denitrificans Run_A_D11]
MNPELPRLAGAAGKSQKIALTGCIQELRLHQQGAGIEDYPALIVAPERFPDKGMQALLNIL